ncbi:MAG: hypothetical protein JNJ52_07020 [Flavobacterium sp.]|nr:hypothetical protein [Flavobacterium sp.]
MLKKGLVVLLLFWFSGSWAQEIKSSYTTKKIAFSKDTISIEKKSINANSFKIVSKDGIAIDSTNYKIDFKKGTLIFNPNFTTTDSLIVNYINYPEFLTKTYSIYDGAVVVPNNSEQLFAVKSNKTNIFKPFDGLTTSGSITRGITIGNNQNATVNSNLDLQITGKISDKVSLRASIQDSNIPLQDNGYSQRLDEFDQIFIEIFSDKWNIRGGDLFLENRQSKFLNFNKKVQGLSTKFTFGKKNNKTEVFASGAVVRGQYARSSFTGQEGNQGPYKLKGNNGELFVLIISGSERVFVNGILQERGENNQYVIDYNAGEITFTSLFPITSEMRIVVEYQYSDRNFTRFVTYGGAHHYNKNWSLGGYIYSENDVKNQPLQQNLSEEQVAILQSAGDNSDLMIAPSAFEDAYSENKVLYRKILAGTTEVFEYSNNPNEVLYSVRFSLVGNNLGNYVLANNQAIGKIYEYVAPIAGVPQGNYEPIIRLIAPTKIQIATLLGKYNPSEKTSIDFEVGVSNNDVNLYSSIDDENNKGIAGKLNFKQRLFSKKFTLDAFGNFQLIQKDFKTIERLFTIEFNRDWNITNPFGNQSLLVSGLDFNYKKENQSLANARYQLEKLDFSENFSGIRHLINGFYKNNNWTFQNQSSALNSDGSYSKSEFIRSETRTKYHFKKNWIGGSFRLEDNKERLVTTNQLSNLSQKFSEYGAFAGRGDSLKVYAELGYLLRKNDSLQNGFVKRVNSSNSYYIKSRLLKTDTGELSVFVNYRNLVFEDSSRTNEPSLNSRILYNDSYLKNLIQISTSYETTSGTIPQQEFTYLEVEPGQGVYMWNDYNSNGIQELQEFEVAPFPDQAKYVRVFLPNQIFVKTHQNKFAQSLTLNPSRWQNESGFLKILSHFYNQTSFNIDRKIIRNSNNFDLNPFYTNNPDDLLGLNSSWRNSLFYNKGRQKHSVTYTYLNSSTQNLLSVGLLKSDNISHQLQYTHLYKVNWLANLFGKTILSTTESDTFSSRNFEITGYNIQPKISYLFNKNASWDVFYEFQTKENQIGSFETLTQNRFGTSFTYSGKKQFTANGEFSFYNNNFNGSALSAVGFQMLEGLQPGKNQTWRLLIQKNLTQYLDVNINYQGRKSETNQAIHTGSIQLRAYF